MTAAPPSSTRWKTQDLGDVVVLMGKGHETYQEIQGVKHHLDEREEVANYFAKQKG